MPETIAPPVAAGLAAGICFVLLFAIFMSNFPDLRIQSTSSSGQVSIVVIQEGASMASSGKSYEPQVIRIVIGLNDTVRWINQDTAPNWIEADNYDDPDFANETLNPKLLSPGESFEYTFAKAGEFGYHGKPHQRGTVIVLPAPSHASLQNLSLGQLGNLVKPINPQATIVRDTVAKVNGTALSELSKTSSSGTIDRVNGTSKPVANDGQAELSLNYGLAPNDQQIISTTITNTGTQKFYLIGLLIKGGTIIPETGAGGIQNLDAYVVDTGYSPEVWGKIPKPPVTDPVVLNPGESFTGYITGKWTEDATQKAINSFSVGATYVYNIDATGYEPGNGWSISISDVKLP